jgi:O-methyltransferase
MNPIKIGVKKLIQLILGKTNRFIDHSMMNLGRKRKFEVFRYLEYVRLSSLELVAQEIYDNNITGAVAELGVYQGFFAQYINKCFPDRTFYLFDTFEGFHENDSALDKSKEFSDGNQDFSNTNLSLVMSRLEFPNKCVIKQGYFPDSLQGMEDKFAFVSLDADLFAPTYEGLKYFYPRLNQGGFIFVHDYNNEKYKGVKEAVRQFCKENSLNFVPITDPYGTVIIGK